MESFDRFAHTYGRYNIIQKQIIQKYINSLSEKIVDLGCGSEGLCKYRNFKFYLGVDSSKKMIAKNPCNTILADFNTPECYEIIKKYDFDQIVSFSALQWAEDIEFVFKQIHALQKKYLLAIFTSNTFKTLHSYLNMCSPIYSKEEIIKYSQILSPKTETLKYKITFKTPQEMLRYIKFSGVGGNTSADIVKLRKFIKEFPFNFLEFEIVVLTDTHPVSS